MATEVEEQRRWWQPDFVTVMVLLVFAAIVLILTFELWHTHFGAH